MKRKFSRQAIALFLVGQLCMALAALLPRIAHVNENICDFARGFGVAMMIGALFTGKSKMQGKTR